MGVSSERPRGTVARLRRSWAAMGEAVDLILEQRASMRVPWWARPLRVLLFVALLAILPFRAVVKRRSERSASALLRRHASEVWRTSPHEALAIVRAVHEQVAQVIGKKGPFAAVVVEPYGKFDMGEAAAVSVLLYDWELALGHHEAALALVGPPTTSFACLRRVDCLLGMSRRDEAIACLRANLHLDGPKASLSAKLTELEGSVRGGMN